MCTACDATAVNKLVKLYDPCEPSRYGKPNYNLRAYKAGKAPAGFPLRPYKQVHDCKTTLLHTIQSKVDKLACSQRDRTQFSSSDDESLSANSEIIEVHRSSSGSSSSD